MSAIRIIVPRLVLTTSQPRRRPAVTPRFSMTMALMDCSTITVTNQATGTSKQISGMRQIKPRPRVKTVPMIPRIRIDPKARNVRMPDQQVEAKHPPEIRQAAVKQLAEGQAGSALVGLLGAADQADLSQPCSGR